ncbi:uncharacterized protein LOC143046148 [Mytilus galloprovincialis]|uniref:uncharacterized protein LOC143046148 n=1 Tax=Mytilus galloprovincialis TaxID=29158 RepID=UPI003F7C77FC
MEKEQYIMKMEQALTEVNQIKQQLQRNAAEVKSEIHSSISRQLEALRNREVWLLNQVELIQNMKDEVLHIQQARLNKMLGVAQSCLTESLGNKFDSTDLKPDENPWISFKYDAAKLRESITSYGRVESSNRPPNTVFVKPGHPARSLPPHFEDYDDADHHVLYKTVEGATKSSKSNVVTFTLPILSSSLKDWLAYSNPAPSNTSDKQTISFPAMSSSNKEWLTGSTTADSISPLSSESTGSWQMTRDDPDVNIQMWLKDIKQNPVIEDEDDFEVISKKEFMGADRFQRKVAVPISNSAPELKYMDQETWLKPESQTQTGAPKSIKLPSHLENSGTETWLCKKWKRNAKSSCEERCGKTGPLEIENICDYLNDKVWIKSTSCSDNRQMEVCKANEPCQGPDHCVATSHCFYTNNAFPSTDTSQWLLNGGKNIAPTTPVNTCMFQQFRTPSNDEQSNMWLKSGNKQQSNLEDWKARPIELEEKVWIKKDSSNVLPESTTPFTTSPSWDKVMTFHSQLGNDQWLFQESRKQEYNPWILKNSSTDEEMCDNDQWIYTKMDDAIDILQ